MGVVAYTVAHVKALTVQVEIAVEELTEASLIGAIRDVVPGGNEICACIDTLAVVYKR